MDNTLFRLRFEGHDADQKIIDMRQLGHSLIGFERTVSTGFLALSRDCIPKRTDRFPLVVKVQEPRSGSFEIITELGSLAGYLPVVHDVFVTRAADLMWRWISWVLLMAGGRPADADPHFKELLALTNEMLQSRERSEERTHQFMLDVLERVLPAARQTVAPIGPSADSVRLGPLDEEESVDRSTVIDWPIADAVRSKEKIEVGDMVKMRIRVDGFTHHNRQLKVENPEKPGTFITAYVRDPVFEQGPSVYTQAAEIEGWLSVDAKPTYKSGKLASLYVMNAEAIAENAQGNAEKGTS